MKKDTKITLTKVHIREKPVNEALLEVKDETALFCLDADGTIIDGHTHNIILDASKEDRSILKNPEAQWNLVKHLLPIGGNSAAWHTLFHTLAKDGHAIAIVSFSDFGETILPRFLHEIIGLEQDFIHQHICIISFLPENQSTKKSHLSLAQEKTRKQHLPPEKIVLCDDRDTLVWDAIRNKYKGVFATHDGTHIHVLLEMSKSIKEPKKDTPYSSPRAFSSSQEHLRNSPIHTALRRTPECGLESSGEHDVLRNSRDGLIIN